MSERYILIRFLDNDFAVSALNSLKCINKVFRLKSDELIIQEFKNLMYYFNKRQHEMDNRFYLVPPNYFDYCFLERQDHKPHQWENSEVVCLDTKKDIVWLL